MRSDARKALRNRQVRGTYRSTIKTLIAAVATGDAKEAMELFGKAQKALDKAAQKGVIKKNTAARKKSRLNKMVKDLRTDYQTRFFPLMLCRYPAACLNDRAPRSPAIHTGLLLRDRMYFARFLCKA